MAELEWSGAMPEQQVRLSMLKAINHRNTSPRIGYKVPSSMALTVRLRAYGPCFQGSSGLLSTPRAQQTPRQSRWPVSLGRQGPTQQVSLIVTSLSPAQKLMGRVAWAEMAPLCRPYHHHRGRVVLHKNRIRPYLSRIEREPHVDGLDVSRPVHPGHNRVKRSQSVRFIVVTSNR
jgi:hypothetical protein